MKAREVYAACRAAGFSHESAIMMTAISKGESGWDPKAVGDTSITDSTWGPSVGLFQIRTLKAETGKGTDRDITALQGSVAKQAKAAYAISNKGTNWTPWTIFTNGAYKGFLDEVKKSISGEDANAEYSFGDDNSGGTTGNPFEAVSSWLAADGRNILIEALGLLAGVTLVASGLFTAFRPQIHAARAKEEEIASAHPVGAAAVQARRELGVSAT